MEDINNALDDIDSADDELKESKARKDWRTYLCDECKDVEAPPFHFRYQGVGMCPLGDVQAVKAKAKNGKTLFGAVMMAAALGDTSLGFDNQIENARVLYVDTEQAEYSTIGVQRRVHKMIGEPPKTNNPNFKTIRTRGLDPKFALDIITRAIVEFKPTLVWLDGIRDLVYDFNDVHEGGYIVREFMNLASANHCAIMCVLHTNKGDDNMRGHLGAELVNKVSDVFQVTKVKEGNQIHFKVEQTEARNQDMPDFEFELSPDVLPIPRQFTPEEQNDARQLFSKCLPTGGSKTYGELVDAVMANDDTCKSATAAKRRIKAAFDAGLISQKSFGKITYTPSGGVRTTMPSVNKEVEVPF